MAIVSCPECGKKLKIADTSVGKKVKGPCGHVFVAQGGDEAAPTPAVAVTPEKVYVGCTECGAKLKVATTSVGKKMKCPKCSATFIASLPAEEPAPKLKAKANPDDDMDDLLAFAKADAATGNGEADDGNPFKNEPVKSRVQHKMDEEDAAERAKARPKKIDDDEPMPKGKKPGKPSRKDQARAEPVYPSRLLPNILVTLMLLSFGGLVGAIFFDVNIARQLGLPEAKGVKPKLKTPENGGADKQREANLKEVEERNKNELARLEGTWIVESPDDLKGKKYTFADGQVTTPEGQTSPFSVDTTPDPKWINLPSAGKTSPGIYEIDGDTLRFCIAIPRKGPKGKDKPGKDKPGPRPKKFDATEGALFVLIRKKEGAPNEPKDKDRKKKEKNAEEPFTAQEAAEAQVKGPLTQAAMAYFIKNGRWPKALQDLVDSKPPYLESKDALIDPWKQPYKYDPNGKKNNGLKPDIWTVNPENVIIGNWPAVRGRDDSKDKQTDKDSIK